MGGEGDNLSNAFQRGVWWILRTVMIGEKGCEND